MLEIKFDEFEERAREMSGQVDQLPFAMSRAMNEAARETRRHLVDDVWPKHMAVKNTRFMGVAMRTEFATKFDLHIALYDRLGRANVKAHVEGGTRSALNRNIAIPPAGTVIRGAHGVPKSQLPRAVIDRTPKRALRVTPRGIFVGEGGRLRLRYTLKPQARIKPQVPMRSEFEVYFVKQLDVTFQSSFARAMLTRRPRA